MGNQSIKYGHLQNILPSNYKNQFVEEYLMSLENAADITSNENIIK